MTDFEILCLELDFPIAGISLMCTLSTLRHHFLLHYRDQQY